MPSAIETPRLLVRRWTTADAPAIAAAITRNIEHLRPWMPWIAQEPLRRRERIALIRSWDEGWDAGGDAVYGMFLDGQIVGGCGLHNRHAADTLEIGYWVDKDHVGRGYATEAARALTDVALAAPGIDRVEIRHDRANLTSERVPARLRYERIGEVEVEPSAPAETGIHVVWARTTPIG
jgi:RimJ/RimL family protein N-acetyltransferase